MLTLKLPVDLESRLNRLSEKTRRPKSYYMREALSEYLEEYEDAYLALDRLNNKNAKYLNTKELEKRLGL
ncbi:MAG TPA: ribbon-helix-helix domain-containing protein [Thermodesulfovibrionales bacterium]|nr:ribbon-helix-helix domain-containing protein [Thermodesulfovibrionales bacterium]